MKFSAHPLWLVGFRPFFVLACLSGLSLPAIWMLLFTGAIEAQQNSFSILQWHAHEMFFGFGWAILGGFLLTATKNWVEVRGYHGYSLMFLAAAWLFERAGMWFEASWPPLLFRLSNNLFLASVGGMLIWTLIRNRHKDSYRDNYFFLLIIPAFLVAKNLMLSSDYAQIGWSMALGLFRMAFLVMLERTLTQFMKNLFQVAILRNQALDLAIKGLGLTMVFESLMPPALAAGIALLLALLLSTRLAFWHPQLAMRRLDLGIMYLGYLAIIVQLVIGALDGIAHPEWVGTLSIHVFTFGAMGLVIPAMVVRIAKGHTGRKVVFEVADKVVLWIMMLAFACRIVAPQIYPVAYLEWLYLAAAGWFAGFALLSWRYFPFLLQARIDGKEH